MATGNSDTAAMIEADLKKMLKLPPDKASSTTVSSNTDMQSIGGESGSFKTQRNRRGKDRGERRNSQNSQSQQENPGSGKSPKKRNRGKNGARKKAADVVYGMTQDSGLFETPDGPIPTEFLSGNEIPIENVSSQTNGPLRRGSNPSRNERKSPRKKPSGTGESSSSQDSSSTSISTPTEILKGKSSQQLKSDSQLSNSRQGNSSQKEDLASNDSFMASESPRNGKGKKKKNRKERKQDSVEKEFKPVQLLSFKQGQEFDDKEKNGQEANKKDRKVNQETKQQKTEKSVNAAEKSSATNAQKHEEQQSQPEKKPYEIKPLYDPDFTAENQKLLAADHIFPLKKKSTKFASAKYFCRLCEYHCDTVAICFKHVKDTRHSRIKDLKQAEALLKGIPEPSQPHIDALTTLLLDIYEKNSLSDEDIKNRGQVFEKVKALIQEKFPDVTPRMYGSSVSKLGLKGSDLNVDITHEKAPHILLTVFEMLKEDESGYFTEIRSDFSSKVPSIHFNVSSCSLHIQLAINSNYAIDTSELLATYANIDERMKILAVALRHWASICKIDKQDQGTLSTYAYDLFVVHFLQSCNKPVLPVLHEIPPLEKSTSEKKQEQGNQYFKDLENLEKVWSCQNKSPVGILWVQLLKYYCIEFDFGAHVVCIQRKKILTREEKKWVGRKMAIEDPFLKKRNIARTLSHTQVYEFVYDRFRAAYRYFGMPKVRNGPSTKKESSQNIPIAKDCSDVVKESTNETVRSDSDLLSENGKQNTEVSESQNDNSEAGISEKDEETNSTTPGSVVEFAESVVRDIIAQAVDIIKDQDDSCETPDGAAIEESIEDTTAGLQNLQLSSDPSTSMSTTSDDNGLLSEESPKDVRPKENVSENRFVFEFSEKTLSDPQGPAVMCSICLKEGHLKQHCPDENLPPLQPLRPMRQRDMKMMDDALQYVPKEYEPTKRELQQRSQVLQELEDYIQQELYPDAHLCLFGSSCNGFGFKESDLDICLTFEGKTAEDIQNVEIIEALSKKLKKNRNLFGVFPITTAKVPIVKFKHRPTQLEGDISLYNTLARHNTRLLQTYCDIDPRVKSIGYIMKAFAKICDIGDASRGSLSSYAYILMVLYYLQQRKPPVIPTLQELPSDNKKDIIVDGWNTWFYDDIKNLHKVWPGFQKNKETVAELWVGLLKFYTEEFNFKDHVIAMRQHKPMTRFEKLWNGKCVAIEDPFDLSHNLGAGISRKMNTYIVKALRKGRLHFCSSFDDIPSRFCKHPYDLCMYLFDVTNLTDGDMPPTDRCCRVCGKIGHFAKECPVVLGRKERQEHERQRRKSDRERSDMPHQESEPAQAPVQRPRQNYQRSKSFGHTPPSGGFYNVYPNDQSAMHHVNPQNFGPGPQPSVVRARNNPQQAQSFSDQYGPMPPMQWTNSRLPQQHNFHHQQQPQTQQSMLMAGLNPQGQQFQQFSNSPPQQWAFQTQTHYSTNLVNQGPCVTYIPQTQNIEVTIKNNLHRANSEPSHTGNQHGGPNVYQGAPIHKLYYDGNT